jgi:hypothetical protein
LLLLLVVAQTWPLVRHLGRALPGTGAGDNVTNVWNLWWMRHVGSNPLAFFHTEYLLWPFGANLVLHTHTLPSGLIGATLLKSLSVVEAQNVILLVLMLLNAVSAYALAFDITKHRAGSIMAAIVFGGAPYFAAHLEGHFNLIAGWVIPAWILFARRAARSRLARDAAIAGAMLAIVAYSDYYYFVFSIVAAASIWVAVRGRPRVVFEPHRPRKAVMTGLSVLAVLIAWLIVWIHFTGGTLLRVAGVSVSLRGTFNARIALWVTIGILLWLRWTPRFRFDTIDGGLVRADGRVVLIATAVFCTAVLPLELPALRLIGSADYVAPPNFFRSASPGIDVLALIDGNPRHPLVGRYVSQWNRRANIDQIEDVAWLGVVPAILAAIGLRRWPDRSERRAWGLLLGVFLLWALGPFLRVGGWNTAFVLPQTVLRYLPIVSNARIPGRAMVVVYLALAMLCAMGLAARPARSRYSAWLLIALTAADFASAPIPLWPADVPSVYEALRTRGDPGALVELPMGIRDGFGNRGAQDPGSPLFQTVHEHPVVGGFVARIPSHVVTQYLDDDVFGPLLRASEASSEATALPAPSALRDGLRARGVRYVMLRRSAASAAMTNRIEEAFGASVLARDSDRVLFEVR